MSYHQELGESEFYQAMNALHCREELRLLASHALEAKLSKEGDQWCFLLGENIQTGCCGFGDTPHQAALDFQMQYYGRISCPKT